MKTNNQRKRSGFSLLELLAVVTILGIVAAIIVPRVSSSSRTAQLRVHAHNVAVINSAIERFFIDNGRFPVDINEIATNPDYFPENIPPNPAGGPPYAIDVATNRVIVDPPLLPTTTNTPPPSGSSGT